jgi:hypothetical protein
MNNFERTAAWLAACGKEPDKYQVGIALSVQIGCQIEEVTEFWGSMYFDNDGANKAMQSICAHLEELAREVKSGRIKAHRGHREWCCISRRNGQEAGR